MKIKNQQIYHKFNIPKIIIQLWARKLTFKKICDYSVTWHMCTVMPLGRTVYVHLMALYEDFVCFGGGTVVPPVSTVVHPVQA